MLKTIGPSWSWIAWDGQIRMPRFLRPPLITGVGRLQDVEFVSPKASESTTLQAISVLQLSGLLLPARRSHLTIVDDPSWSHYAEKVNIWRIVSPRFESGRLDLGSHCFTLYEAHSRPNIVMGVAQFDDLSTIPENFVCLMLTDERLPDHGWVGGQDALKKMIKGLPPRADMVRRYWLLLLERCPLEDHTYRRVGLGVAAWRRINNSTIGGIPIHKQGQKTRLRLI